MVFFDIFVFILGIVLCFSMNFFLEIAAHVNY